MQARNPCIRGQCQRRCCLLAIKGLLARTPRRQGLVHDTAEKVRSAMGQEEFRKHFIDVCATASPDMPLWTESARSYGKFFSTSRKGSTPCHSTGPVREPERPPRPRFRYQIAYKEKGDSFYHIAPLQKACLDPIEVTMGESIVQYFQSLNVLQPSTPSTNPSSSMGISAPERYCVLREERNCGTWNSRENAMWTG